VTNAQYSYYGFAVFLITVTVAQATLSGNLRTINVREFEVGKYSAVSIARTGSPLVLLSPTAAVSALCQDIKPAPPALPPPIIALPPLPSWFGLDSYQFCGAWQYEGFSLDESPAIRLTDMVINQFTR
jgi:hypothetical protein